MIQVGFKRLNESAIIPTKSHPSDSGFDLCASEDVIIQPGETKVVKSGVAVHLPEGYEAQVRPRSGVTSKTKLRVQIGTIDQGYTGEIGVIIDNINQIQYEVTLNETNTYAVDIREKRSGFTETLKGSHAFVDKTVKDGSYLIRKGDRIAQLVIQEIPKIKVEEVHELPKTERGSGGFGSTGYN